jgi:hypothetical protein
MKYAIEMGSGALMYIPSFIKIGSGVDGVGWRGSQADSVEIA